MKGILSYKVAHVPTKMGVSELHTVQVFKDSKLLRIFNDRSKLQIRQEIEKFLLTQGEHKGKVDALLHYKDVNSLFSNDK